MNNGGDKLGYIVMPMDLTERQALIYLQLYKKCNFQDMTVKYTLEQLSCDIRIVDLPTMTIYKNIKTMIDKGYIELIKKASKGNAPIYRLVKFNEILGKPKINQEKTKGKPKHRNISSLEGVEESQGKTKGKPKVNPIKDIKNKDINNIYSHWNSKNIICHKSLTKEIEKAIDKALETYTQDEIIQAINVYDDVLKDKKYYFNYKWSLKDFLNRSNGLSTFMEDGTNTVNYLTYSVKNNKDIADEKDNKPILRGWN